MNQKTIYRWAIGILLLLVVGEAIWICTLSGGKPGGRANRTEERDYAFDTELSEHFDSALENGDIYLYSRPLPVQEWELFVSEHGK